LYYFVVAETNIVRKGIKRRKGINIINATMMHLRENIKLIRLLSNMTQPNFGKLFGATKAMIVSYEKGKANPDSLFINRLAKFAGISESQLKNTKLTEDLIKLDKEEKVLKGERKRQKEAASLLNIELLAADDFKKFRGLIVAKISAIEANLKVINNKCAEINKAVTGEPTTKTLTELEQTTKQVAKMLQEEFEKMFP
jgi:transcriptional regulator with XRE-family HTH domain